MALFPMGLLLPADSLLQNEDVPHRGIDGQGRTRWLDLKETVESPMIHSEKIDSALHNNDWNWVARYLAEVRERVFAEKRAEPETLLLIRTNASRSPTGEFRFDDVPYMEAAPNGGPIKRLPAGDQDAGGGTWP